MRISLRELLIVVAVAALGCAAMRFSSGVLRPLMQLVTAAVVLGCLLRVIFERGARQVTAAGFLVCALLYGLAAHIQDVDAFGPIFRSSRDRLEIDSASLPTRALLALHTSIIGYQWVNARDGSPLDFDPTAKPDGGGTNTGEPSTEELVLQDSRQRLRFGRSGDPSGTRRGSRSGRGGPEPRRSFEESRRLRDMQNIASTMEESLRSSNLDEAAVDRALLTAMRNNATYEYRPRAPLRDIVVVGHSLLMLIVGYCGGQFAALVYRRRRPPHGAENA
jgi:hypothetical protein